MYLRFYLDQLIHFLSANSRHGTHSPFLYHLVDEVIYAKRQTSEPRDPFKRLTARLIERVKPTQVYVLGDERLEGPLDFVIAESGDADWISLQIEGLWSALHPGSVVVLEGIHRNDGMKRLWRALKAEPEATVTVDLFHAGLVFFHQGQAKEDFKIRL
ncbi:hypothetical protein [Parapedobacter koreensis]|uniref:Uncharacterized protein n=1 Tax=Parapedobacter koreensis TaxID=332977 RepID=A0A1H7SSR6_9SPHI|nr:hypothetical protein [Parapedobacter koreensis]SEL75136.1 hypothetical protein SAMN05421740_109147 [Parapedobacter koreensis]